MKHITYAEYQVKASTTAMYYHVDYPFMLLMEEFNEYLSASKEEENAELGDIQWAISQCYKELGLMPHTPDSGIQVENPVLSLVSILSKAMRKHQITLEQVILNAKTIGIYDNLVMALNCVNDWCEYCAQRNDSHITDIRLANLAKLADRKKRNVIDGSGDHR